MGFLQSLVYPLFSIFESLSLSLVRISSHVWCFGLSATFGDRAGFMAEGDDKEKVSVLMSLQELINTGKGIGYSGAGLQTFVRDQQDRQREERQLEREARREDAEREARREQAEREARKEEAEREARKEEAEQEAREAEREARKEEAAAQERKWQAELNLRNEEVRLRHELDMTRIRSERRERAIGQENDEGEQEGELEEVEGRRKPPRIPMPKFDHDSSQDVSHF